MHQLAVGLLVLEESHLELAAEQTGQGLMVH